VSAVVLIFRKKTLVLLLSLIWLEYRN